MDGESGAREVPRRVPPLQGKAGSSSLSRRTSSASAPPKKLVQVAFAAAQRSGSPAHSGNFQGFTGEGGAKATPSSASKQRPALRVVTRSRAAAASPSTERRRSIGAVGA